MGEMEHWKERIYDVYASAGQLENREELKRAHELRAPYIKKVIESLIPSERAARIVDIGCGHGDWLYVLKQKGYNNIQGVDVSAEQADFAREMGVGEVEVADGQDYLEELGDGAVDVVLLMDVLEHLTRQELFEMLDQVYRVLRTGGRCIAHVPNAEGLYAMGVRYGDLTHELAFTPSSVRQLYSVVGFSRSLCIEDKPVIHGFVSFLRRFVWEVGTVPVRLLKASETGRLDSILSRNMLAVAVK